MDNPIDYHGSGPTARHSSSVARALYVNAVLLGVLIVVLAMRDGSPRLIAPALGQQAPIGGGAGVFIVPGQFSVNTWGLYLIDVDAQTLCAYQYSPGEKELRLVAARNYRFDRRLGRFNTDKPSPEEVRDLVDREKQDERVKEQNNTPASPEAPAKQD
jgi:hypothetical protein